MPCTTGARLRFFALAVICAALALAQSAPTLAVTGDVPSPLQLSLNDLAKMPRQTVSVHEMDGSTNQYEGVPLAEVLKRAGAPIGAMRGKAVSTYVLAKAHDGYEVVFTLGEIDPDFGNESIIVADKRNGEPLSATQGPFRIVCPNDKHGARSERMLETLEVVRLRK
jgi:DMSO/TMAO reductase YedYZ molybdopterin-dependent catalytic subunit